MCSKFTGEHPCRRAISIKLHFIEIILLHGCSPVNLLYIFRILFPRNTSEWLLLTVAHSLTNKFQPLDISVNKAARFFISDKCNFWFVNEVSQHLRTGKVATYIKVFLKLSVFKPLHPKWFADLYNTLKDGKEMAINGFRSADVTEFIENARYMVEKYENPFKEVWL